MANYFVHINPFWTGHIPAYAQMIWTHALQRGYHIVNVTDNTDAAEMFTNSEAGLLNEPIFHQRIGEKTFLSNNSGSHRLRSANHWRNLGLTLQNLEHEKRGSKIYFHQWADLFTDSFLEPTFVRNSIPRPWSCVCIHPVEFRVRKSLKRRIYEGFFLKIKQGFFFESRMRCLRVPLLKSIYFPDENIVSTACSFFGPKVVCKKFPEISTSLTRDFPRNHRLQEFKKRGMPIMGILGVMQKRKGYLQMLEAARAFKNRWGFLFAGQISFDELSPNETQYIQGLLQAPPCNVCFINETLSDSNLNALLGQCDMVSVAYRDFYHSANLQIKAAQFQIPVLVGPRHLSFERNQKFQLGVSMPGLDASDIIATLSKIGVDELKTMRTKAQFASFVQEHDQSHLDSIFSEVEGLQVSR